MAPRKNLPNRKRPYKPRETPYRNRGVLRGPEPQRWCTGPDPTRHEQYTAFLKSRAQARFREESWTLTFEEFEFLWNQDGSWFQRGRGADDLMMTRRDSSQAWSRENAYIELRRDHLKRLAERQRGKSKINYSQGRKQYGK